MSIRVICEPSVHLVGRQQVNVPELDRFLAYEGFGGFQSDATKAGEELVEVAGRTCYMSFGKPRPGGNAAYLKHILEAGHGSVLEHEVFNFLIAGVSRSLTHQLTRHRAGWSYSELSQRFVDGSNAAFVVPPEYLDRDNIDLYRLWYESCEASLNSYRTALRFSEEDGTASSTLPKKRIREAARSVLPECTETKIFVTVNARALRHFLEMRGSEHADAEICRLAHFIRGVLAKESPNIFGDYTVADGAIHTSHKKV